MIAALIAHVGMGLTALTSPPSPSHSAARVEVSTPVVVEVVGSPALPPTTGGNPALDGVNCQAAGCFGPSDFVWVRDGAWCFQAPKGTVVINSAKIDPTCGVKP